MSRLIIVTCVLDITAGLWCTNAAFLCNVAVSKLTVVQNGIGTVDMNEQVVKYTSYGHTLFH